MHWWERQFSKSLVDVHLKASQLEFPGKCQMPATVRIMRNVRQSVDVTWQFNFRPVDYTDSFPCKRSAEVAQFKDYILSYSRPNI